MPPCSRRSRWNSSAGWLSSWSVITSPPGSWIAGAGIYATRHRKDGAVAL